MSDNVRTFTPRPVIGKPISTQAAPAQPSDLLQLAWRLHANGVPFVPLGGMK